MYFAGAASDDNLFFHVLSLEIATLCVIVVAACYMARAWLLLFSMRHTTALNNKEWGILINPDLFERNWFIRNADSYGDEAFVARRAIVVALLIIVIRIGLNFGLYFLNEQTPETQVGFSIFEVQPNGHHVADLCFGARRL